jgi:hypothetical protein
LTITEWTLKTVFEQLYYQRVPLEGMVLKPNMVISGKKNGKRAGVDEVAEKTVKVLKACVPAAVPGIAFLSGGQSDEEATAHLDAMNKIGGLPWHLTFSYGRALQAAPQKAWSGKNENVAAAEREGERDEAPHQDVLHLLVTLRLEAPCDHRHLNGDRGRAQACQEARRQEYPAERFVEQDEAADQPGRMKPLLREACDHRLRSAQQFRPAVRQYHEAGGDAHDGVGQRDRPFVE